MKLIDYLNVENNDPEIYFKFFDDILYSNEDFTNVHVDKLNDILEKINPDIENYDIEKIHTEFLTLVNNYPDSNYY